MKKRFTLPLVAMALFGLIAAFATTAQALPTSTMVCNACHALNTSIVVSATPVSNNGAVAKINIVVTNPYSLKAWAVFRGSTKVAGSVGTTGTVSLPAGIAYRIIGAGGDGSGVHVYSAKTITPAAVRRTVKVRIAKTKLATKTLTGLLTRTVNKAKYKATLTKSGGWVWATFKKVPLGTYRLTVTGKKFTYKARTYIVR